MALTKLPTAALADNAVDSSKLDLADNYAFTGTVTGTSPLVKISTTTISSQNTDISLPTGYRVYKLIGSNLTLGATNSAYDIYTTADNFSSTDTDLEGARTFQRIETGTTGAEFSDAYVRIANNMANDPTDNLAFELTFTDLTLTRTTGYGIFGFSLYGHTNDQQSYRYSIGGRSQTTSVMNGIRVRSSTASDNNGTISLYGVVM